MLIDSQILSESAAAPTDDASGLFSAESSESASMSSKSGASVRTKARGHRASGVTLLEIMIVLAVMVILAAIAVPMYLNTLYAIRLKSAASDLSGFIQRARMQAAKNNATYQIKYQAVSGAQEAYLDVNLNGVFDAGEPVLAFSPTISMAFGAASAPAPYVLVGDTAGTTYDNATTLGYSPRGLPCAYAAGVCATPAAGYFVYYLRDQRPTGFGWAAVVVTRGGRSKVVSWNGTLWQ